MADDQQRLKGPIHAERPMRVIVIGAGASGLCFAYKLQRSFSNFSLTVYEKNAGVSGTWFENRYPGCACDVPSHNYVWSFEPKYDWTGVYAKAPEIYKYFDDFAKKYHLHQYIKTNHKTVGAQWDESAGKWYVNGFRDLPNRAEYFLGTCRLRTWRREKSSRTHAIS